MLEENKREEKNTEKTELKRTLGFFSVLALSITSIMGTGTFLGARLGVQIAGKASIFSWIILFFISVIIAMIFAELSGMYPKAGGLYEFAKQTYGRGISFLTGWTAWMVGNISIVLLIVAGLKYLLTGFTDTQNIIIASIIIIVLNIIAFIGVEFSSGVVLVLTILLLGSMSLLLIPAFFKINLQNILPITYKPIDKMLVAALFLAESFFGWEAASYLSEETKNPRKTIPLATITGAIIVGILVIGIVIALIGIFGVEGLKNSQTPFVDLANVVFNNNPNAGIIVSLIIAINLISSAASGIVTQPRLLYSMAKDKLFLHSFSKLHKKTKTPLNAIILQTILSLIIVQIAFGNYEFLLKMLLPLAIIIYLFMIIALPILRIKKPYEKRSFKMPLGIILSTITAIFFIYLLYNWAITEREAIKMLSFSFSLLFLGIPIYLLLESYYDPEFITKTNETLYPILKTNFYDRKTIKEIELFLEEYESKRILIIGGASPYFIKKMLKKVGPSGLIYITSFSKKELEHLKKMLEKFYTKHNDIGRIIMIHDKKHFLRIPPEVKQVDVVISSGFLSYIQNIDLFLLHLKKILPKGGQIIFLEYINHFHFLPDPELLSDFKKLEETFKKYDFNIQIKKQIGLLQNKIIIYGIYGFKNIPYI